MGCVGGTELVRASKIQISRIAVYWAIFTFAFALLWTVMLSALGVRGVGAALSLFAPGVVGGVVSVLFYLLREHLTLEYDDHEYKLTKGRTQTETHQWSEFKECSVIRDGYGRIKVRAYVERDGKHFDVDTPSCGMDPYKFRDFMAEHIMPLGTSDGRSYSTRIFAGLEREIQRGRANWVADLNETIRDYQVVGEIFPLIARGSTRPKGFLLSRFVAVTIMPNYQVCLYAHDISNPSDASKSRIMRLVRIIEGKRDEKDIKWSWLLLFCEHEAPESVSKFIEEFGNKDVGIGCLDIRSGKLITSRNQLGSSLRNRMRFNRLVQDINKRRFGV
jgi:hypothetical protein